MKRLLPAALLVGTAFGAALIAAPLAAQDIDVSGDWDLTIQSPQGPQTIVVTLVQEGTAVEGTAALMGNTFTVSDGVLEDSTLTFVFSLEANGNTFNINLTSKVDGDAMEGTLSMPTGDQATFSAKRREGVPSL